MAILALSMYSGLLVLALAVILVLTTLLFLQLCAAVRPANAPVPVAEKRPHLAVLMPAHNESAGIAAALQSVQAQLAAGDRLLVVADNCSDDTASLATAAGAEVAVRDEPLRRGKGYALDFGVRHLEADPPEIVVIVDADCTLGRGCLDHLAQTSLKAMRPVQALDLMHSPPGADLPARLGELAWLVKNEVRPLGGLRLGMPCQLMGTGMAFPWALVRTVALASGHIAEDLVLGLDLASLGTPPLFCPQAVVSSSFPAAAGLGTQRTRWEHGHLSAIASHAPRLLWRALTRRQPQLAALVLDLCVPPLSVLALVLTLGLALAVVLVLIGGSAAPVWLALAASALSGFGLLQVWWRFGRSIVSLTELLAVPGYVLAKLPRYARFAMGRRAEWVRTKRDDGTH